MDREKQVSCAKHNRQKIEAQEISEDPELSLVGLWVQTAAATIRFLRAKGLQYLNALIPGPFRPIQNRMCYSLMTENFVNE